MTIKLKCKGGDISEKVVMKQEMKLEQRAKKWRKKKKISSTLNLMEICTGRMVVSSFSSQPIDSGARNEILLNIIN